MRGPNSGDTGKALPQEQVTELNGDQDTMAFYNSNKQEQNKSNVRALEILRAPMTSREKSLKITFDLERTD